MSSENLTYTLTFQEQELEDLLSALSFFVREYPDAPQTKKAMEKLEKRLHKTLNYGNSRSIGRITK